MVLPNFFKSVRKQGNTFRLFGKKHKNIAVWIDPPKTAFCLLYAISPFSYHRSSVAQIEPLCQPPEHNRKVLAQPHKESCLSAVVPNAKESKGIPHTRTPSYSLERTILLLPQNIARSRSGKNSAKPSGDPVPGQKRTAAGISPVPLSFFCFLLPMLLWRKAFSISPIIRSRRGVFGTERIAPLHREALPTSALHIAAAQPAAKDPRSIHRLFCDPLKRPSPFKSAVNLRLPRCRRTRTFSGLVCTKPAISLSEY